MKYNKIKYDTVEISEAKFEQNNSEEIHLICEADKNQNFSSQINQITEALKLYIEEHKLKMEALVLTRFFLSDAANQEKEFKNISNKLIERHSGCAISVVQQPALNGSKLTVWAYLINSSEKLQKTYLNNCMEVKHGQYKHIFHTQLIAQDSHCNSNEQTDQIFRNFDSSLKSRNLTIKNECIRTWIYVKDVDYNYAGVVVSRREYFDQLDMTAQTHFITSTGIEGRHFDYNSSVLMDAYSIGGVEQNQIKFLSALEYLNPTHEYGVTFERGTSVDYGDRRHIFLSGTASIDNKGEVVHPQNIHKQIERTITNVEALLQDAEAGMKDIAQLIVYLRDIADYKTVEEYFTTNYTEIPKTIVLAPVCRPGWLIEMECIAIKPNDNKELPNF